MGSGHSSSQTGIAFMPSSTIDCSAASALGGKTDPRERRVLIAKERLVLICQPDAEIPYLLNPFRAA